MNSYIIIKQEMIKIYVKNQSYSQVEKTYQKSLTLCRPLCTNTVRPPAAPPTFFTLKQCYFSQKITPIRETTI